MLGVAISQLREGHRVARTRWRSPPRCCSGVLMIYCFWMVLTTGAFWLVRMDQIVEMFEGVFQTGRWPVGVYPEGAAVRAHVPGAHRLRGHRPGGGHSRRG